ncbi:MAG: hypothetical protein ACE5ID_00040 [Acidobacteriota bacterium]
MFRFDANLTSQATHREEIDLTDQGDSGETTRFELDLRWTLSSPRTRLFAIFSPYYEEFLDDNDFSTYGGSAGVGLNQRVSSRTTWSFVSRFQAAPEQDVPAVATAAGPPTPRLRALVPRNGFFSAGLEVGLATELSPRGRLEWTAEGETVQFNTYDVQDGGPGPQSLSDQERVGLTMAWVQQTSSRHELNVSGRISRYSLDDPGTAPGPMQDNRNQYGLSVSSKSRLAEHTGLTVTAGVSSIESEDGRSDLSPVFGAILGFTAERLTTTLTVDRRQEIFIGSRMSVDTSTAAGRMDWRIWRRGRVSFSAAYGSSSESASGPGSNLETRTRRTSAAYEQSARLFNWTIRVYESRQRSEGAFGENLQSMIVSASLSWKLTRSSGLGR